MTQPHLPSARDPRRGRRAAGPWRRRAAAVALSLGFALGLARPAQAQTGVCDSVPGTSDVACINSILAEGRVVNDIFRDSQGRTAEQLPVFGDLYNQYTGCTTGGFPACNGTSRPPYECPGEYDCLTASDYATARDFMAFPDHRWSQPHRSSTHTFDGSGCPIITGVPDGVSTDFNPWEGLIFDLGGPSNQVAIFAENDHGPQPCESFEYTVYLTNNPASQEIIANPTTEGADPNKWNRAVLARMYTWGWFTTRSPDPAAYGTAGTVKACGDTAEYATEDDSFVMTFQLPCGINFRYASVIAGYDGAEFPLCAYYSSEGEIDAVAGLTEDGTAVCNDADGDLFVDCNCVGHPTPCDCADGDPTIYPGAPEACDQTDRNCDALPGACPSGQFCVASVCVEPCGGGEFPCARGSSCRAVDAGPALCIPDDCTTGGCPAGSTCDPVNNTCRPACDGVVCARGQVCQAGACVDACQGKQCPAPQECRDGACKAPCSCFLADTGCTGGEVCDRGGTDQCVPPGCQGVSCPLGERCDAGVCRSICDGTSCPATQVCIAAEGGCVSHCAGVTCGAGQSCDPATGLCSAAPDAGTGGSGFDGGIGSGGTSGTGATGGGGGSAARDGGFDGSVTFPSAQASGDDGGCGCRTADGAPSARWGGALGLLAGALGLGRARARRSKASGRR